MTVEVRVVRHGHLSFTADGRGPSLNDIFPVIFKALFSLQILHSLQLEVMERFGLSPLCQHDCRVTAEPWIKVHPHSLPLFGFSLQILFHCCHIFTSVVLILTHKYICRSNMGFLFWPLSCHVFYERKKIQHSFAFIWRLTAHKTLTSHQSFTLPDLQEKQSVQLLGHRSH